jgi:hypothetical protein
VGIVSINPSDVTLSSSGVDLRYETEIFFIVDVELQALEVEELRSTPESDKLHDQ